MQCSANAPTLVVEADDRAYAARVGVRGSQLDAEGGAPRDENESGALRQHATSGAAKGPRRKRP
jgi:hypothetical protein